MFSSRSICARASASAGRAPRTPPISWRWATPVLWTRRCSMPRPKWRSGWSRITGWIQSARIRCWGSVWSMRSAISSTLPTRSSAKSLRNGWRYSLKKPAPARRLPPSSLPPFHAAFTLLSYTPAISMATALLYDRRQNVNLRAFSYTLLALPVTLSVFGCNISGAAPRPGVATHAGHPAKPSQGWTIRAAGTAILAQSPDRNAFALISPLHLNGGMASAEVCARSIVPALDQMPALKSSLSGAQLTSLRQVSQAPDTVVAELRYDTHGAPGQARLLCRLSGEDGQAVLIAARQSQFARYQ